jgi:Subtilase family
MKRLVFVFLFAFSLALVSSDTLGQIRLQSRTVQPSADETARFLKVLRGAPGDAIHGLATFSRAPTEQERRELERQGVRLLSPFQGYTYRVRVAKRLDPRALKDPVPGMNLTALIPEDRVAQPLWREDFARYIVRPRGEKLRSYVLNPDGTLNLTVRMHRDVAEAGSRNLLQKHAVTFQKRTNESWAATVTRASLRLLAAEDAVQWIDAGPLPFLPENDGVRAAINVDPVQNFDLATGQVLGLGGKGVQIGLFDKGMDNNHGDVVASVIRKDNPRVAPHATHEAGTIAGSGARSTMTDSWGKSNSGTPYQWRGMAPLAQLIDANYLEGVDPARHLDYIVNLKMDLSNHSYAMSADGSYSPDNEAYDQLIRGDALNGTAPIPGRLHVTSAGNNGAWVDEIGNQTGYFSLTKQMKNALVVGGWDVVLSRIEKTSSLGPAHDGRIKPDVVAPVRTVPLSMYAPDGGVKSAGYCTPDTSSGNRMLADCVGRGSAFGEPMGPSERKNFYTLRKGTSMASAATTGSVALVLEQFATSYAVDIDQYPPLPSSLRGVMIHTARDIEAGSPWPSNEDGAVHPRPGPDFVTGWGLIDVQAAVNVVANRKLLESKIPETCYVATYFFTVPPGATGNVRITLAWDDPAGDSAAPITDPKLVNDLDLVLIDPSGTRHQPWQLDQKIQDAAGNPLTDEEQLCGTAIQVKRDFMPVADPTYVGPGDPGNVNDTIPSPPGGMPAAVRGNDHLNNVEVVDAPATEGTWQIQVTGFKVALGPQSYSIVGLAMEPVAFHPMSVCALLPKLCAVLNMHRDVCKRFPKVCANKVSFPKRGQLRITFADLKQKIVLPMDVMCRFAIDCPIANAGGAQRDLQLAATGASLRVAIYSSSGRLVKRNASASPAQRLRYGTRAGEQYFIVLSPGPGVQHGTAYDIALTVK